MKKETCLITGITGTLGTVVSKILLSNGFNVIGISRDELKQQNFIKHPNLKLYIGDIKDLDSLMEIKERIDCIFHFAAMKHVDVCNNNINEAIKTNITGTQNILNFQKINMVEKVIFTSTDKAFRPLNLYGKTKSVSESLVLQNQNNVVCRYGNVFGSRGSVIYKFLETLKNEKKVYITNKSMTRYYIRKESAANFVINSMSKNGLQIPEMQSTDIITLAKAAAKFLKIKSYDIEIIGNRGDEKLIEELDETHNSENAVKYSLEELIILIGELNAHNRI